MLALNAAAYAAVLFAGYAAGITLLVWRCIRYAEIVARQTESGFPVHDIGVEQLRSNNTWFVNHVGDQIWNRFGLFRPAPELWNIPAWLWTAAGLWLAVFLSAGLARLGSTKLAPKVIRVAARGTEGAAARMIWNDALRKSVARIRAPLVLAAAFLLGIAVVVCGDLAVQLSGDSNFAGEVLYGCVMNDEALPILFATVVVPFGVVWIAAGRRIKRNSELTRCWCVQCGYWLWANRTESSERARCPECGHVAERLADRPHVARHPVLAATALLAGLALLLGLHHWGEEIPQWFYRMKSGGPFISAWTSDRVIVKVGGVVRMERPDGTIWFRFDLFNPPASGSQGGALPIQDAVLRIVTDMHNAPQAGNDAIHFNQRMKLISAAIVLSKSGGQGAQIVTTWTPIAISGAGDFIGITYAWVGPDGLIDLHLHPSIATSIQAVDPATAPLFDAVDQPPKP